jgi:WhiB family redox-sensing transcriptional regulator
MFAIEYGGQEERWRLEARCRDGAASLTELFFSEALDDIARAKAFCAGCVVREECLGAAVARREPWGVWGGELLANGKVLAQRRRRGRPPKAPRPEDVLPTTWELAVAEIA